MFQEKVVVITGAATGIGRETAKLFASRGASVVISDINKDELQKTAKSIKNTGGEVLSVITDVSDPDDVKRLIDRVVHKYRRLDIACNNAGIGGEMNATADYSLNDWDKVLNINLRGQWLCMKYQIPVMLSGDGGSIVNISSILGSVGFANAPAYTAAKHGLEGLSKTAALEYAPKGIRVNTIAPGFIETPMLKNAGITDNKEMSEAIIGLHPVGRLGKPREVADAIAWLSSDEASFVTGHTLLVDGGYTAR